MLNCKKCNKQFESHSYNINGTILDQKYCIECEEIVRKETHQVAIKKMLITENAKNRVKWQTESGLVGVLFKKNFDNFDKTKQIKAWNLLSNYKEQSVVLLSPSAYGIGKTHLVCALVNKLIERFAPLEIADDQALWKSQKCPVYFTTEPTLLDKIRATFNKDSVEKDEEIYDKLIKVPYLVIDDVGKLQPKDPAFLQSVYYRIIDGRSINELPIILTTNLDYAQLESHIGGASADRLRGMCGDNMIKMTGKSCR